MANTPVINSFNAGELSPYLYARNDLKKYNSGCLTLENFQALPYGGAIRRPAIKWLAETKNDENVNLIEFEFSSSQTYVLEFGDEYIRFYKDGAQLESAPSTPYEIVSPYDIADVHQLRVVQSADVMWIVHPDYPVNKLSRFSDTSWTIAEETYSFPVFREENTDTADELSYTGTLTVGSSGTLQATGHTPFNTDSPSLHIGSYWELRHLRTQTAITVVVDSDVTEPPMPTSTLTVTNSIKVPAGVKAGFNTQGTYAANQKLAIWRTFDEGTTWEQFRYYNMEGRNVDTSWTADNEDAIYAVTYGSGQNGTFALAVNEAYDTGVVKITAVTDSDTATCEVVREIGGASGDDTTRWSEGAWSAYRGYPQTIALWETRLIFASTTSDPQTMWLSTIDDFNNFNLSTLDDAAMTVKIGSGRLDEIRWMVPQRALIIGTAGSEWALQAESDNKPVTPDAFSLQRKTTYGSSSSIGGVLVNSAVLFVMRQGRKIREFVFNFDSQDYVAPDLTVLAEHITEGGIVGGAYQQQPDNILLSIRADGTMIPMTYERDQDVTGFQRWNSDDFTFESVAILSRDNDEDAVYVSCSMGDLNTRHIGLLDNREWGTDIATEWNGSDFYTVFDSPATTTLSGLDYLEGKTVDIVRDGMVEPQQVVASGEITITKTGDRVVVGLPYTSTMAPMYVEPNGQFMQPMGKHKGLFKAVIRFKDTIQAKVGQTLDKLQTVKFRSTTDALDTQVDLFNGEKKINFDNQYELLHTCYVVQDKPLPMTVVAMIPSLEVHE